MADSIGIGRVPTHEEQLDYTQLGTITPKKKFLAELAKVEMDFVRERIFRWQRDKRASELAGRVC